MASGNERALADTQLLDRLSLNLQPAPPGFAKHQLSGRMHVPGRIARARFEDTPAHRVAGRVERARIAREVRRGSDDAELRRRRWSAGGFATGAGVGYVGDRGAGVPGGGGCWADTAARANTAKTAASVMVRVMLIPLAGLKPCANGVLYFPNEQEAMC